MRRLIGPASPAAFRLFDAAAKSARCRSFSRWAILILSQQAGIELERAGIAWSYAEGRPLKKKGRRK